MCSTCNTEIKVNHSEAFLRSTCTCVAGIANNIALLDDCSLGLVFFSNFPKDLVVRVVLFELVLPTKAFELCIGVKCINIFKGN